MAGNKDILNKYFDFTDVQLSQFAHLEYLYRGWNDRINVISRKDVDNIFRRHILHSLAIAKFLSFDKGCSVLDLGTGGGLPGIPLAIMFPDVAFSLIDGTGKKIMVVNEIIRALKLKNVKASHQRAEDCKSQFDFVVTRAVAQLDVLWSWCSPLITNGKSSGIYNGLIALKGGDLKKEINKVKNVKVITTNVSEYFDHPFYNEKKLIHVSRQGHGG